MRWAIPPLSRHQLLLISKSLDEVIPDNHPIRQLDDLLSTLDWSEWENTYVQNSGQPAIHPRSLCGAILFGLLKGIRSSRKLEDATNSRIDFMWLLENRRIDHTTFALFRRKHTESLKKLFHQINEKAIELSKSDFIELSVDGTKIKACASRDSLRSADFLKKHILLQNELFSELLMDYERQDVTDDPGSASKDELLKRLNGIEKEKCKYEKALEKAEKLTNDRQKKIGKDYKPVSISLTDPDSRVMPNKEGGYAPNYTPTVIVDKDSGLILDSDVVDGHSEASCVIPGIENIEKNYGKRPANISMDGNFATGENLSVLESKSINVYSPAHKETSEHVLRPDLEKPVASEVLRNLPTTGGKFPQILKSAFIYNEKNDCYVCPMGKALKPEKKNAIVTTKNGSSKKIALYLCVDCKNCSLQDTCLGDRKKFRGRTITRDQYEGCREHLAERMKTKVGKEIYTRRMSTVETVFGHFKGNLNVRNFLTRGIESIQNEWRWLCTAYNLGKWMALRARTV